MVAVAVTDVDATLLRAVAAEDEAALRVLYERHATRLSVRLLRRCSDGDLVADVLHRGLVGQGIITVARSMWWSEGIRPPTRRVRELNEDTVLK